MSKHTPGPWFAREPNGRGNGWSAGPAWLGEMVWSPETEANARLIAAAPELLDFAKWILSRAHDESQEAVRARAAIAKAEGGQDGT